MRIVLLVFLTTLSLASSSHKDLFDHFLKKYSKTYSDVEYHDRLRIFTKNYEYILSNTGKNGTLFAVNEYTDLTLAELRDTKFLKVPRSGSELLFTEMEKKSGALPPSFDWRLKGAVTSVQNQGQMGVEIFPIVDSVSSCYFKYSSKLVPLSYNQVAECTPGTPNPDIMDYWKYILTGPGLDSASCYHGGSGQCKFDKSCCVSSVTTLKNVQSGNETALQYAVYETPVVVGVDASHQSFQMYAGGVYYEPACTNNVDHLMLVVGWGSVNGEDFWIVKNSWGELWGIHGYIFMARNRGNNCGISTYANFPLGCGPCKPSNPRTPRSFS